MARVTPRKVGCHLCGRSVDATAYPAHAASCLRGGTFFYTHPNFEGDDSEDENEPELGAQHTRYRRTSTASTSEASSSTPPLRPAGSRSSSASGGVKKPPGGEAFEHAPRKPRAASTSRTTGFSGEGGDGFKRSTSASGPPKPPPVSAPPRPQPAWGDKPPLPHLPSSGALNGAARLERGRKRMGEWDVFVATVQYGVTITYDSVPWIGCMPAPGASATAVEDMIQLADVGLEVATSAEEVKRVMRAVVLRWHPDKFQQQFGPYLAEGESERIMERVNAIASSVNRLRRGLSEG